MAPPLHVANGHGTTRLIEAAGLPGRTSIWADPLHDGPVPDAADDELIRVRARFLASNAGFAAAAEAEAELRGWRRAVDDHGGYDELVLWFEHDLFDQLNLLQLLSRAGRDRPTPKPVSLVSIDSYPGHPRFKGLGELLPDDIAALFGERRLVTPPQFALAAKAWDAFRSGPEAVARVLREDTSALPFLAAALQRHLEERVPGADGLTRSERRLLEQLARGPLDLHEAWRGMHEHEQAFYITDTSFWSLVQDLSARSPRLITVSVSDDASPPLPQGTLSLSQ